MPYGIRRRSFTRSRRRVSAPRRRQVSSRRTHTRRTRPVRRSFARRSFRRRR